MVAVAVNDAGPAGQRPIGGAAFAVMSGHLLHRRLTVIYPSLPCYSPQLCCSASSVLMLFFRPLTRTVLSQLPRATGTFSISRRAFGITSAAMAKEFKIKDLTSLDLKNGDKKEVEVEGIEEGKVLLVKVDDQVHALNSKCTHYGAPLVKGVLTKEGRLTCPWHGGKRIQDPPPR